MGKKDVSGKKRKRALEAQEAEDPELEAELAAVLSMKQEKENGSRHGDGGGGDDESDGEDGEPDDTNHSSSSRRGKVHGGGMKNTYNADGLLQSLQSISTQTLPFVETLQICEFDLDVQDEHDDLQREVS